NNAREARMIYSLQSIGGFGGINDQLNQYATFVGHPDYFQQDLARFRNVTAKDVRTAAQQYLIDKRLVVSVMPRGGGGGRGPRGAGEPAAEESGNAPPAAAAAGTANKKRSSQAQAELAANLPKPQADPSFKLPTIQR